jgi:hypothetical protein
LLGFHCVRAVGIEPSDVRRLVGKAAARLDDMELGPRESDFFFLEHDDILALAHCLQTRASSVGRGGSCRLLWTIDERADEGPGVASACSGLAIKKRSVLRFCKTLILRDFHKRSTISICFRPRSEPMRMAITALSVAGAIGIASCQSAGAVVVDAAAMKEAASAASTVQQARFYGRGTRHHVVKCYREVVIGPYVCHRFHRW